MRKIVAPIFTLLFMMSCGEDSIKNEVDDSADTLEVISDYNVINQIFQDVGNTSSDGVFSAENSTSAKISNSKNDPIITITPLDFTTFPKTIRIDFQDGVIGADGITRKGIVTVISTNWLREDNSEHTTTFDNYYHNDYLVEGTHYTKNLGENEDGNIEFNVKVTDGKITNSNVESITFSSETTRTWVSGADTPLNILDDEYMIDGMQSGTSSKGIDYLVSTTEALHFQVSPRSIKSGILNLDIGTTEDVEINYNDSTITILGVTFPLGNN